MQLFTHRGRALVRAGSRVLGLSGLCALAFGACIIEEREYDQQLANCTKYCNDLEQRCTGVYKVYDRADACMAVCAQMDPGNALGGSAGNTLACRLETLRQPGFEAALVCPRVGPGGNGTCGTNCDALCDLRQSVCTDVENQTEFSDFNRDTCIRNCNALPDESTFDATRDRKGDTLQCRLVHISEAAISKSLAVDHCVLTQTSPTPGETAPCSDPADLDPEIDCEKYCGLVMGACENQAKVYESAEQCEQVCALLDQGLPGDTELNTVRCRRYHSYAALGNQEVHCTHAGPTGDGHCGSDNCNSYCRILKAGCPTRFETTFGGSVGLLDVGSCEQACEAVDGADRDGFFAEPRYSVTNPPVGNNLQCRTYHAVKALAARDDLVECGNALADPTSVCY